MIAARVTKKVAIVAEVAGGLQLLLRLQKGCRRVTIVAEAAKRFQLLQGLLFRISQLTVH